MRNGWIGWHKTIETRLWFESLMSWVCNTTCSTSLFAICMNCESNAGDYKYAMHDCARKYCTTLTILKSGRCHDGNFFDTVVMVPTLSSLAVPEVVVTRLFNSRDPAARSAGLAAGLGSVRVRGYCDNLQCRRQWWQSWHYDNSLVPVQADWGMLLFLFCCCILFLFCFVLF